MTAAARWADVIAEHRAAQLAAAPPLTDSQKAEIASGYLTDTRRARAGATPTRRAS